MKDRKRKMARAAGARLTSAVVCVAFGTLSLIGCLEAGNGGGDTSDDTSNVAEITAFVLAAAQNSALSNDVTGSVDDAAIAVRVPYGADVTALVPTITISAGATVSPASGDPQDFTDPVTYTVTAADGATSAEYSVTVTVAPEDASDACEMTGFIFEAAENTAITGDTTGTVGSGSVSVEVTYGTDVTALVPTISVSAGASVNPSSGVAQDFSSIVTYTVTAEDAVTTQEYAVTVSVAGFQEVDNVFDSSTLLQQIEHGTVNYDYDRFGGNGILTQANRSIASSADGSTLVVGAPNWQRDTGANPGAAFVFEYSGGTWTETARLEGSKGTNSDGIGWSVAISRDGSVIALGAIDDEMSSPSSTGLVYVYERSGDSWASGTEDAILSTSNAATGDSFGWSLAMSGDSGIITSGAYIAGSSNEGHVYVFERPGGGWSNWTGGATETARLEMGTVEDGAQLGKSLAISLDGSTVFSGAPFYSDVDPDDGGVFVFEEPAGGWAAGYPLATVVNEAAILTGSDTSTYRYLGDSTMSVSDSGDILAVGCHYYSSAQSNAGGVFIYRSAGAWSNTTEDEIVTAYDSAGSDYFGVSLDLSAQAGYLIVGAAGDDLDGINKGSAYLYELDAGSYTLSVPKFSESGIVSDDSWYGHSVTISPDASTVFITAPRWDSTSYSDQGTAFIYQ